MPVMWQGSFTQSLWFCFINGSAQNKHVSWLGLTIHWSILSLSFLSLFGPINSIFLVQCNSSLCHGCKRVLSPRRNPLSNFCFKYDIQLYFCAFPSLLPPSQLALEWPNFLLTLSPPSECHFETFPPHFCPCKLLVPQLHHRSSQPCKNTHMPHAVLSSWYSFFSSPQAHSDESF